MYDGGYGCTTAAMAAAVVVAAEEGATAADSNPVLVSDTRPVPIVALIFCVFFSWQYILILFWQFSTLNHSNPCIQGNMEELHR
jgi:hypothetical protein